MYTFAFTIICLLMSVSNSSGLRAVMKPGPTVISREGRPQTFICLATVRNDWHSTIFYDAILKNGTFICGIFLNESNKCESFSNSPDYTFSCSITAARFEMYIRNITSTYNNTSVKCKVQYGTSSGGTVSAWAETTVEVSDNYRLSLSTDVVYNDGNVGVTLTCVTTSDAYSVAWKRNNVTIRTIDVWFLLLEEEVLLSTYTYSLDRFNQRYYLTISPQEILYEDLTVKWQCLQGYSFNRSASNIVALNIMDFPTLLLPTLEECQSANTIELNCTLNTTYVGYHEAFRWVHSYNGRVIRELNGRQNDKSFILHIPFCIYQDFGDYTCVWKTDLPSFSTMKTTTKLLITGPPIISSYNVTVLGTDLHIYVMFSSLPETRQTLWVFNGKSLELGLKYTITTITSEIPQTLHDVSVFIEGYITKLTIRNKTINDEGLYTCILENNIAKTTLDINTKNDFHDTICSGQSSEYTAGVAVGCIFATFIVTVMGHVFFRWFVARRKGTKHAKHKGNTTETYDELGARSLPGVYDLGILSPSSVYENVESGR